MYAPAGFFCGWLGLYPSLGAQSHALASAWATLSTSSSRSAEYPRHNRILPAQLGAGQVILTQSPQPHALLRGGGHHGPLAASAGQRQQKVQAAVYAVQLDAGQGRAQRRRECLHTALVGKAHPGQVPGKIPARHELAKSLLLKPADRVRIGRKIAAVAGQQALGQHHTGNADARRKAFGKGRQVDDRAVRACHALQAGQRPRVKAKLRVVVVLQNVPSGLCRRPGQQLGAAGRGHRDAGREMMARRQVAEVRAALFQRGGG